MSLHLKGILPWIFRVLAALIMLQTLFFKFTAAPESVYIFSRLGMEPWGRIGTGIGELVSSILIFVPAATAIGALLGAGLMAGALYFHLTKLGIEVQGDSGQLFAYALIVLISCISLIWLYRKQLLSFV